MKKRNKNKAWSNEQIAILLMATYFSVNGLKLISIVFGKDYVLVAGMTLLFLGYYYLIKLKRSFK